jgi:hypothetical protein
MIEIKKLGTDPIPFLLRFASHTIDLILEKSSKPRGMHMGRHVLAAFYKRALIRLLFSDRTAKEF